MTVAKEWQSQRVRVRVPSHHTDLYHTVPCHIMPYPNPYRAIHTTSQALHWPSQVTLPPVHHTVWHKRASRGNIVRGGGEGESLVSSSGAACLSRHNCLWAGLVMQSETRHVLNHRRCPCACFSDLVLQASSRCNGLL